MIQLPEGQQGLCQNICIFDDRSNPITTSCKRYESSSSGTGIALHPKSAYHLVGRFSLFKTLS